MDIKAAVWENEADQKKYFNVTFARTYVDEANFSETLSAGAQIRCFYAGLPAWQDEPPLSDAN